jgi:hypothetical protein
MKEVMSKTEVRERLSKANLGKPRPDYYVRQKISMTLKGRNLSEETKENSH